MVSEAKCKRLDFLKVTMPCRLGHNGVLLIHKQGVASEVIGQMAKSAVEHRSLLMGAVAGLAAQAAPVNVSIKIYRKD